MSSALDIREDHVAIARGVLRQHLPAGTRVRVLGSPARGGARRRSDPELPLECKESLRLALIGQIAEALSESDLLDKVDLATVDPAFRTRIEADCVALLDDDAAD